MSDICIDGQWLTSLQNYDVMLQEQKVTQVYGISPEELKESILQEIRFELESIRQSFQVEEQKNEVEYLTRKEAAKLLKISLVTISDWNKKGILKPYRIGNLIRYKRDEIEAALIQIKFRSNRE